jgi:hypothetical protein
VQVFVVVISFEYIKPEVDWDQKASATDHTKISIGLSKILRKPRFIYSIVAFVKMYGSSTFAI